MTSLIAFPYIREQTINDSATVKNGEGVFTHTSPHSSAPVTDRGTPAVIVSTGPAVAVTELRTHGWALKEDVQVRACVQPCHSADVNVQEAVLKWLKNNNLISFIPITRNVNIPCNRNMA